MLKVWGRRSSFNVQKVMWLTGELGLEHERIDAGGSFGGLDAPEFRARNPHGLVPVIDDGGIIVWESHAILRYLAARYVTDFMQTHCFSALHAIDLRACEALPWRQGGRLCLPGVILEQ